MHSIVIANSKAQKQQKKQIANFVRIHKKICIK